MKRSFLRSIMALFLLTFLVSGVHSQKEELRLEILNGHSGGRVLAVAVSSDGKFALTGSTDTTALLWDLATGKQLRRFTGYHEDAVSAVQFSKDGQYVLTASHDGSAQLWQTATGKRVHGFGELRDGVLIKDSGKILSAAISPDMKLVATAGEDKTARIWDFETGKQIHKLDHAGQVNSIAFSPDSTLLLTGGEDKIVRIYSTGSGIETRQFVGHTEEITSVAFSSDGAQILTGSSDKTGQLWNVNEIAASMIFRFQGTVLKTAFMPHGRGAVITEEEQGDHLFDTNSGKEVWNSLSPLAEIPHSLRSGPFTTVSIVTVGHEEEGGISLENEPFINVIDFAKADYIEFPINGNASIVKSVAFASSASLLMTGGGSLTSGLWNLNRGFQTNLPFYYSSSVDLSLDGRLAIASYKKRVVIIDTSSLLVIEQFPGFHPVDRTIPTAIALSSDGSVSAIGGQNGKTILRKRSMRNSSGGKTLDDLDDKPRLEQVDTKSPVGSKIGRRPVARVVDEDRESPVQLEKHDKRINAVAFSPRGTQVATASSDRTLRLSRVETGESKILIKDFTSPVWGVAFSPDGKTIATAAGGEINSSKIGVGNAASGNGVRLFDVATGKGLEGFGGEFRSSTNNFSGFKSVAYSPDGKFIAAGSFDGKVYLRNNGTKGLKKFEGHTDTVNSVKFAKDANGKLLVVSGSSDSTTRIWNAATGEEICALVTFRDRNWAVVQSKTGRYDASNGGEIKGIQWVYGNETIALSQLKDVFYTPNLLPRLLGYNKEPLRTVPDLNSLKLFPKIIEQTLDEANALLTVKLQNRGGGIGEVRISVNGKLATEDARDAKLKANPNATEAVITFDLKGSAGFDPQRKNTVEVITNNYDPASKKGYISSRGAELVYGADAFTEVKQPNFYAVVGGVSDYNGTSLDLAFAAKDAEEFGHALEIGARRLFCKNENLECDKVKVTVLSTSGKAGTILPTKVNYRQAIANVAKAAKPEDVFVIYLAGHGTSLSLNGKDTYLYLTQEADSASKDTLDKPDIRSASAISSEELLDWLTQTEWVAGSKGVQALKQVMILDTCAAGSAAGDLSVIAKRDLTADQILALERLKDRTGFHILMGSAADQSSYEANRYGQGLLTYALLQGIAGAALDKDHVATQALFDYALRTVPTLANGIGGIQQPRVFGSTSIPIGLITDSDKNKIKLASPKPVLLRPLLTNPETGDDDLRLIVELRKRLGIESSYEVVRRRDGKEPVLVYIDDDTFTGGIRVTGTYTVVGDEIRVKAFLRKDGKTVAELPNITFRKESVVNELLAAIRSALLNLKGY